MDPNVHNRLTCSAESANRPPSEHFWTIQDLRDQAFRRHQASTEIEATNELLLVEESRSEEANGGSDLALLLGGYSARLNHWSFGQLCSGLQAPADYLRTLPAKKAAELLDFELDRHEQDQSMLWVHENGHQTLLAMTSPKYGRIPSYQVCDALLNLPSEWRVPPARPAHDDPADKAGHGGRHPVR